MAKRKRLTPANPSYLAAEPAGEVPVLETKSALPRAPLATRPPIAAVAGEASTAAALGELTETLTRARAEGRLIQSLPLRDVHVGHLVRDRLETGEEDLTALIESLRARGQQTPIEVVDRGEDVRPRYGLISGWRRMTALARLAGTDPKFDQVLAIVRQPQSASDAYVAMVEENEIRVGLSYYERARIALKSVEHGVYPDLKLALNSLYANVSRAKRSKIKSFTTVVAALDGNLRFPTVIGERLGLELAKHLAEPRKRDELLWVLKRAGARRVEDEQAALANWLKPASGADVPAAKQESKPAGTVPDPAPAPVHLDHDTGAGQVVLSGDGVDEAFVTRLRAWLARG